MKFIKIIIIIFILVTSQRNAVATSNQVLAVVGSSKIHVSDFFKELRNMPENLQEMAITSQGRMEILETMVIREMILIEAKKEILIKVLP